MRTTDNSIHVLLIEDNPGDVRLIEEMVRDARGPKAVLKHCSSLTQGLDALSENTYSVILLDLGLPDSCGFDTFVKVHSAWPQIPVVVLTGTNDEHLAVQSVRTGAQDYLIKGQIDSSLLSRSISYAIERAGLLRVVQQELIERKAMESMLRKIDRALRVLSECNQIVVRATEENVLAEKICGAITALGEYQFAWVAFTEPNDSTSIQPIAIAGSKDGNSPVEASAWFKRDPDSPLSEALKTGKVVVCDDVTVDKRCSNLKTEADKLGYRSFIILPLLSSGRTLGILQICSREPDRFDREELKLLDELKEDVAYAIVSIRTAKERKRAEEELRESESRFRIALENSPIVVFNQDRELRYTWIYNPHLKFVPQALLGKTDAELLSADDAALLTEIKSRVLETGATAREEVKTTIGGQVFFYDLTVEPLRDLSGNIIGVTCASINITERKRAERLTEALFEISKAIYATGNVNELFRHIHRVLSSILQANNFFIALLTDDGKTLSFPYKCDEKGTNDWAAIGVDDSQSLTVEVLKTKKSLLLDETGLFDRYATGRNRVRGTAPKCWLGVPLMMGETVIGVMAVQDYHKSDAYSQKDVTLFESAAVQVAIAIERKRAQDALRGSEHRTRTFLDSTSDMAFLKDDKFRHILANRALCKFYGKTEDEIKHKKDFDLMSEKAALRCRQTDEQTILSNALTVNEELIGDRCYETVKFPVQLEEGKVGVGGYIRDITERKKFEHDLRLSEERFRSVWDNSADGMRLTDREGRIIDANAAFCKLVRMPREELLGNVLSVAYQREGPDDDLSLYHERFDARETISNLFGSATLRDGESIDLDISSSFIESAGQEKLLLSLFRDVTEKRKSEKRLEDERNLLRTIIDAIPDEIAVKDTERRFFVVNTGTVNAFQRASADEIIGKKDEDLVPGHLVKDWSEEENTVLAGGKCSMNRIANKMNPETGAIERSLMVTKVPLKDHEGKIIGLVGINRDITELKRAEEMLEKERTLLLTLIENIPDEVCLKDLRHRYLTANRAAMNALGVRSLEALIGKTDKDLAPQGLAQEHVEEEEAILESGKPLINRERIKIDPHTGQVVRCLLTTKVPVKDNNGATIGILVVNRHITERKQMEELLRASEQKFRALFEESKDLVYFSTGGGQLLDINPAGIELLGYASKQEILSINMANEGYADSEDKRRFDRQMAQHGFVKDYEVELRRKDGGKVTVLETATAVMDNKGNVVQYRGVMRDVTKQRQLERQFLQAQKMDSLGTLAGGIAHDFNNILGIILGHLALLERTRENTAQFEESVFSINKAVERGASLVRQILTFARKSEAELEPVNINLAAKELAKMVEETFPKLITVTLRLDKTIPVVSMDPTQLHQALLNLCVNARDAMNGQGTLTIATHLAQGRDVSSRFPKAGSSHYVHVSVSDTGTGMDEETRQRIFEPFFTTKEKGKGTGLGLAVVYGVIQVHNGFVDVESTPGAGSTFHLFVPVPEGIILKSVKEAVKNEDLPGGTETVLVVEDEDVLRDILTKLLEMHGYTVISASDGEEAVRRFSEHEDQIDLLLSDMGLPKRSGWDAFKLMQKTKPGVRALMASGYIEPGQKSEILKSGVRRCISKPYRMEEVLRAIRETLDEKE